MRRLIDLIENVEKLTEASRADLYHATGLAAAIRILTTGFIEPRDDGGWNGYGKKRIVCTSRDVRYRYSGAGGEDEIGNPVVEPGHAPVQFVLDADALGKRFRVQPFDMAKARFSTNDDEPDDPYGGWRNSGNLRRRESEERIILPASTSGIPLSCVTAIILEPVTRDWLRFHHPSDDRRYLSGSGDERQFDYQSGFPRHYNMRRLTSDIGNDYEGVREDAYQHIMSLARLRGIPIIDRRR